MYSISLKLPLKRTHLYEAIFQGLFVIFVLLVFQPFGTYNFEHDNKALLLSNYGVIVFGSHLMLRTLFTDFKVPLRTQLQEFLFFIVSLLITGSVCFFYHQRFINGTYDLSNYPYFLKLVFSVYLFPSLVIFGSKYVVWSRVPNKPVLDTPNVMGLRVSGTKETYSVDPTTILYFKSEGNYVRIVYQNAGSVEYILVRSTLKYIEEQLPDLFIKSHRSYIINKTSVMRLFHHGNGSYVKLSRQGESIPVSRMYKAQIKSALKDMTL